AAGKEPPAACHPGLLALSLEGVGERLLPLGLPGVRLDGAASHGSAARRSNATDGKLAFQQAD
ncbi:MAG: hypothetical protein P8018_12125, partial [Acidobacteriota bacterium]